jgi:hypothetical protein
MNITSASRLNTTTKEGVREQGAKEIVGITSMYDCDYPNKKDGASVAEEKVHNNQE